MLEFRESLHGAEEAVEDIEKVKNILHMHGRAFFICPIRRALFESGL